MPICDKSVFYTNKNLHAGFFSQNFTSLSRVNFNIKNKNFGQIFDQIRMW